ncbi:putative quinol monooxygenase [Micromonospora sp. NBC_01796]|uniref:putative quinol monooxygenase n=1 Tax=Micromonospora sp. NBC_01796 TaxID=2975987 RepID=UPI002DDA05EF|nr:putative quinol monooxygenase [Micromonospora sp. NBC_01796]WSA84513.1 antibiotic biosynthesis monooxygenase [Micromonospora sp. NBC_01796]
MPTVAFLARFKVKPGKAADLIAGFRPAIEQAEQEPGTLFYALHRSKDDSELFWISELYADDSAFAVHHGSAVMAAVRPVIAELVAESEQVFGAAVYGKGVPA